MLRAVLRGGEEGPAAGIVRQFLVRTDRAATAGSDYGLARTAAAEYGRLICVRRLVDREMRPKQRLTAGGRVVAVAAEERFEGTPGVVCSFFPICDDNASTTARGLRWPLDGQTWPYPDMEPGDRGLEDQATMRMPSGRLILERELVEGMHV